MQFISRTSRMAAILLTTVVFLVSAVKPSYSASFDQMISQMASNGFNQVQADRLLGHWSSAKHSLVKYAAVYKNNPDKLEVLAKICQNRFDAREAAIMGAMDDAIKVGYVRPIEATVATGGWRKALDINSNENPYDFIVKAATSDIDETFFGKMGATEFVAERTSVRYAERVLGRKLGKTPADYTVVNRILTDGEVTWFPRDPMGRYSPQFEKKFPGVVMESYRGREGQASLEVGYMVNKRTGRGGADIIIYDKYGNFSRFLKNQNAESVIEDLSKARYSTLERLSKAKQDYSHKYIDQVLQKGLKGDDRAEWAAKMLERMLGDESAITGKSLKKNELFNQAAEVKRILREVKGSSQRAADLKKALGGQSLDDFVIAAEKKMKRMDFQNNKRIAWMLDDDIGKPIQGGRLNTVMKGMVLITNSYIITDAYLKSHEGDRVNQMSKALVTSLAADIAGGAVGKVVGAKIGMGVAAVAGKTVGAVAGGAAGFASGAVAGAIAAYAVNGTWEWTEEGVNSLLRGYKGDAAIRKMFLSDKKGIKDFVNMSPDEIKKHIDTHWKEYMQYSGMYKGKGSNDQSDIRQYMLEKAFEHQFLLKKGELEGQIRGNILKQELEGIVKRMESGQLTPDELEKIRAQFGKNTADMIENKLMNDPKYAHYKKTLEEISKQGGKPGLFDWLKSNFDVRSEQQIKDDVNQRFGNILEKKEILEGNLAEFDWGVSKFFSVLSSKDENIDEQLAGFYNQASIDLAVVRRGLSSLQTNIDLFLSDLAKSSGRMKDMSDFNYRKGEASALLSLMIGKVDGAIARFAMLDKVMRIKQKADDMLEGDPNDADFGFDDSDGKDDDSEDDVPGFVKKSKGKDRTDDVPAFVKKSKNKKDDEGQRDKDNEQRDKDSYVPGFVRKSKEKTVDDYVKEFDAQKDDYSIQSIAIETVDVRKKNKMYAKIKSIDSVAVIIRIRGNDHIVDGYNALSLLVEKGYIYSVDGIGYVTSERFDNFMGGEGSSPDPKDSNVDDEGSFLDGIFGNITGGFKKDKNSAFCKKVQACRERFGSHMDKPLSDAKNLPLSDYHALTACRSEAIRFQCPGENSSSAQNRNIDKCSSLRMCFPKTYDKTVRDYRECQKEFGSDSMFTKKEAKARGIYYSMGCDYDLCGDAKEEFESFQGFQKVINQLGGIPKGMYCEPNGDCFAPGPDGKFTLYNAR